MQAGVASMRFWDLGLKGVPQRVGPGLLRPELRPQLRAEFCSELGESAARCGGLFLVFAAAFETVAGAVLGRCPMP